MYYVLSYEYAELYFFSTVAYILADCNSAVNFYLYCLMGRKFREEFLKVLLCWKSRRPMGLTVHSTKVTVKNKEIDP